MDADPRFASNQGTGEGLRVVGERVSTAVESWQDRDQLRAELRACLLSGTASKRVLSVTGHRGIGKSATVAKVLSEFEQVDPTRGPLEDLDAFVYLSPRTGVGSLTLAGVFESLTEVLPGPSAVQLRAKWDRARAAFPSLWDALKALRCVVVLDNLDDVQNPETGVLMDADVVAFIESACRTPYPQRIVCTSQLPLGLPSELIGSVREFPIDEGLDGAYAVALLRSVDAAKSSLDGVSDDELEQATRRLGGLPKGLELLANELQSDPHAATDLLDSDDTLDGLMADLISKALAGLDQAGRWVVDLLALAEVPASGTEVPGLLADALEPDVARTSLRALIRCRLVGFDAPSRRVRLHPLEADWASRELIKRDPARQVELDSRLANWYSVNAPPRTPGARSPT